MYEGESPQRKVNHRRKLSVWDRGKEDYEFNFKGKSAKVTSCRETANTSRNSRGKKYIERKSKDRVSSDYTQAVCNQLPPIDLLLLKSQQ